MKVLEEAERIRVEGVVRAVFLRHGIDLAGGWLDRFTDLVIDLQGPLQLDEDDVADGLALGARRWWPDA